MPNESPQHGYMVTNSDVVLGDDIRCYKTVLEYPCDVMLGCRNINLNR